MAGGNTSAVPSRPWLAPAWPKGTSGNPNGRPKLQRPPSVALAELNDTPGGTVGEIIENYKLARGSKLCGGDVKAIALFRAENIVEGRNQVAAASHVTDRIEGPIVREAKITQDATITVVLCDLDAMLDGRVSPDRAQELTLEAEIVGELEATPGAE